VSFFNNYAPTYYQDDVIVTQQSVLDSLEHFNTNKLEYITTPKFSLASVMDQMNSKDKDSVSPYLLNLIMNGGRITRDATSIVFDEKSYKERFELFFNARLTSTRFSVFKSLFMRMYGIDKEVFEDAFSPEYRMHVMTFPMRTLMLTRGGLLDRILKMDDKTIRSLEQFLSNDNNFKTTSTQRFEDNVRSIYNHILNRPSDDVLKSSITRDLYVSLPPVSLDASLSEISSNQHLYRTMNREYMKKNNIVCNDPLSETRVNIYDDDVTKDLNTSDMCGNLFYLSMLQGSKMYAKHNRDIENHMRAATADVIIDTFHLASSDQNLMTLPINTLIPPVFRDEQRLYELKIITGDKKIITIKFNRSQSNYAHEDSLNDNPSSDDIRFDNYGNSFRDIFVYMRAGLTSTDSIRKHFRGLIFVQDHRLLSSINVSDNINKFNKVIIEDVIIGGANHVIHTSSALLSACSENSGIITSMAAIATMMYTGVISLPTIPLIMTMMTSMDHSTIWKIILPIIKLFGKFTAASVAAAIPIAIDISSYTIGTVVSFLSSTLQGSIVMDNDRQLIMPNPRNPRLAAQTNPIASMIINDDDHEQIIRILINQNTNTSSLSSRDMIAKWDTLSLSLYQLFLEINIIGIDMTKSEHDVNLTKYINIQTQSLLSSSTSRMTSRLILVHCRISAPFLAYRLAQFNQVILIDVAIVINDNDIASVQDILNRIKSPPPTCIIATNCSYEYIAANKKTHTTATTSRSATIINHMYDACNTTFLVDNTKDMFSFMATDSMLESIKTFANLIPSHDMTIYTLNCSDYPLMLPRSLGGIELSRSNSSHYLIQGSNVMYTTRDTDNSIELECAIARSYEYPTIECFVPGKEIQRNLLTVVDTNSILKEVPASVQWYDRLQTYNNLKKVTDSSCFRSMSPNAMKNMIDDFKRDSISAQIAKSSNPDNDPDQTVALSKRESFKLPSIVNGAKMTDYQTSIYENVLVTNASRDSRHSSNSIDNPLGDFSLMQHALRNDDTYALVTKWISFESALNTGTETPTCMHAISNFPTNNEKPHSGFRIFIPSWMVLNPSHHSNISRLADIHSMLPINTPWIKFNNGSDLEITHTDRPTVPNSHPNVAIISEFKAQSLSNDFNDCAIICLVIGERLIKSLESFDSSNTMFNQKFVGFIYNEFDPVKSTPSVTSLFGSATTIALFDDLLINTFPNPFGAFVSTELIDTIITGTGTFPEQMIRETFPIAFDIVIASDDCIIDETISSDSSIDMLRSSTHLIDIEQDVLESTFDDDDYDIIYSHMPYLNVYSTIKNGNQKSNVPSIITFVKDAVNYVMNTSHDNVIEYMKQPTPNPNELHVHALALTNVIGNVVSTNQHSIDIGSITDVRIFPPYKKLNMDDPVSHQSGSHILPPLLVQSYIRYILENELCVYNKKASRAFLAKQSQSNTYALRTALLIPTP